MDTLEYFGQWAVELPIVQNIQQVKNSVEPCDPLAHICVSYIQVGHCCDVIENDEDVIELIISSDMFGEKGSTFKIMICRSYLPE